MKRILAFSFFLAVVCVTINAQLPNTFYGSTLGKTTKHQAIQNLLAQKVHIATNDEDKLLVRNASFEGVTYKNMNMTFYDDILSEVTFYAEGGIDYSKRSLLVEKYTSRYSSFKYYFINDGGLFDDDATQLIIADNYINFRDMKIELKEQQDNKKLYREIHPFSSTRINQNVLGCTLGVSTKQQVINAMKSLGCRKLPNANMEGEDAISFSGTYFEGVSFEFIKALFVDGKLASFMFLGTFSQYDINTLQQHFSSMYSEYDKGKDSKGKIPDACCYDDDRISIIISPDGVVYSNVDLNNKESRRKKRQLRGKLNWHER